MIIKFNNDISLGEWQEYPISGLFLSNGVLWPKHWFRAEYIGQKQSVWMFKEREADDFYQVLFFYDLEFLNTCCERIIYGSLDDAKQHIDNFLIQISKRMSKLTAFA